MSAVRGLLRAYRGRIEDGLHDATRAMEVSGQVGMPLLRTIAAQVFGVATLSTGDALRCPQAAGPIRGCVARP